MSELSTYSQYIYKSRYARYLPEEKRREEWEETVDRYINHFRKYVDESPDVPAQDGDIPWPELRDAILNFEVMPSMRALMTAGKALERDNVAGYNCSYVAVDDARVFDEILYVLMCGTGVGFSVERQYINQLPEVAETFHDTDSVIIVGDSKIGWAKGLRQLIALLYQGQLPRWDTSRVRPTGTVLKTFGGRSSGPEPLEELFEFCVRSFKQSAGRRLNSLEVHDIVCKIAEVVVCGGVRRSALISLSNLSDPRMRDAKQGEWYYTEPQRALANNSVCYTEKPDISVFLSEWQSLYQSKAGERGIFNRDASKRMCPDRRDADHEWGTNPCLHPDSLVETVNGRVKIKDITEPTMVYSMGKDGSLCVKPCSASWVSKKGASTINITIASGKVVRCTPDHKIYVEGRDWIEAKDINIGDRVVHLVRNRRGAAYSGVKLTSTKGRACIQMEHRLVWEAVNGPIPEGYDVHHIDGDTYNNDVDNLECLSHADHASLTRFECANDHMVLGERDYAPGRHGSMWGFVSQGGPKPKKIVPMPEELKSKLHQYATVVSIEEGETTDVYDLTVEDTHNFIADFVVVHNCSEIVLRSKQMCNLTEAIIRPKDGMESIVRKVKLATILGTLQATQTNFRYLSAKWKNNTEEERLLGVSLTGIMDNEMTSQGSAQLRLNLSRAKEIAVATNKRYAKALGINQSAAITCVKPSGTVSQLVDSASGIHPRFAPFYIRRVRGDINDPVTKALQEAGVPCEVGNQNPNEMVFSFPQKAPSGSVCVSDVGAIKQLEHWAIYATAWCEHKPSVSIYVKEHEWIEVAAWVYKHWDLMNGVSFFPKDDHIFPQAPYSEITESEYNDLLAQMQSVFNLNVVYDH